MPLSTPGNLKLRPVDNVTGGNGAGTSLNGGTDNVFLGSASGNANELGNKNTFLASQSGRANTTGDESVAIGFRASAANETGGRNVTIGADAANDTTDFNECVFIGYSSGKNSDAAQAKLGITCIGALAGETLQLGVSTSGVTLVGYRAGNQLNSPFATVVGFDAMNRTGGAAEGCTFVGHEAASAAVVNGADNTGVGVRVLKFVSTGVSNSAMGADSMTTLSTGSENNAVGRASLGGVTTGSNNTAMGHSAGLALSIGNQNSFFGNSAGQSILSNSNTAVGALSLSAGAAANFNTALGIQSGESATGEGGVYLGRRAGRTNAVDNRLFIANNDLSTLIHGEFDTDNVGFNASDYADGEGMVAVGQAANVPTFNSIDGLLYMDAGALHYRSPGGTDTVIGPA